MFQYILIAFGSEFESSLTFTPWRPWEDKPIDLALSLSTLLKLNDSSFHERTVNSLETNEIEDHSLLRHDRVDFASHDISISKIELDYLPLLVNFVKTMRTKYIHTKNVLDNDMQVSYNSKLKNVLFPKFKIEKILSFEQQYYNKLSNTHCTKNFNYNSNVLFRWLKDYRKILKEYLPQIKHEVLLSSIREISKRTICENIESIYKIMDYFETLRPKISRFVIRSTFLKLRYKLILDKLPSLFSYYNFCERFINLYELLIKRYIKEVNDPRNMNRRLYLMSLNLSRLMNNKDDFMTALENKLAFLISTSKPNL
ncbi:uncharacterized protein VNE69_08173 [Vairimorpha necatrix]|uniref:Uncharacterized protein n=1 Tax=Vairimorpha necatrix TaxID=6039 RepID=A0AAX4JF14_9MICR